MNAAAWHESALFGHRLKVMRMFLFLELSFGIDDLSFSLDLIVILLPVLVHLSIALLLIFNFSYNFEVVENIYLKILYILRSEYNKITIYANHAIEIPMNLIILIWISVYWTKSSYQLIVLDKFLSSRQLNKIVEGYNFFLCETKILHQWLVSV